MESALTVFWVGLGLLLGAALGSFSKAIADRSLVKKSFQGRSYCPKCQHQLGWYDLFPILSFLLLQGKCRYCRKPIDKNNLIAEIALGVIIALLFWGNPPNLSMDLGRWTIFVLELVFKLIFISSLAILFITDLKKMLIPDKISIPSLIILSGLLLVITILKIAYLYFALSKSVIGQLLLPPYSDYFSRHALITIYSLLGSLIMSLAIALFFLLIILATRGKGMGGGDVKLGAILGLGLGFPNALVGLMTAFISGAVFSIILLLLRKKHFGQTIPFGPFLSLGGLIALLWGDRLITWYLHLAI